MEGKKEINLEQIMFPRCTVKKRSFSNWTSSYIDINKKKMCPAYIYMLYNGNQ
jgi:hypothetical protein